MAGASPNTDIIPAQPGIGEFLPWPQQFEPVDPLFTSEDEALVRLKAYIE